MIRLQTLGLATALGLAGAVLAQTPSPSTTTGTDARTSESQTGTPPISGSDTTSTSGQQSGATQPGGSASPASTDEDSMSAESTRTAAAGDKSSQADEHRVSKLIGKNVESPTGDTIGEVNDVVIDAEGKATHVIVSAGRPGSTKMVAVPYQTLKQAMKGETVVLDRTRLENAPSFEESNFPNVASSTWSSETDRYWARSRTAAAEDADTSTSGSTSSTTEEEEPSSTERPR